MYHENVSNALWLDRKCHKMPLPALLLPSMSPVTWYSVKVNTFTAKLNLYCQNSRNFKRGCCCYLERKQLGTNWTRKRNTLPCSISFPFFTKLEERYTNSVPYFEHRECWKITLSFPYSTRLQCSRQLWRRLYTACKLLCPLASQCYIILKCSVEWCQSSLMLLCAWHRSQNC